MINFKHLAHDKENIAANLLKRGYTLEINDILEKQKHLNQIKMDIEVINAKVNRQEHAPEDKEKLKQLKIELGVAEKEYENVVFLVPNIVHATVPLGKGAELVRTCLPENGLDNLNQMMQDVEDFVKTLNLKYRIIELCAGDLGFAGHKAYDFELWFANDKRWREIASITWCHDFQARRMNARFKRNGKPELIHTLNGTGLAAGRVMAALLENNCVDGKIKF